MSQSELNAALQRPLNHYDTSPKEQWATDKRLGCLDWDPSQAELREYILRRAEMGDAHAQKFVDKARKGEPL